MKAKNMPGSKTYYSGGIIFVEGYELTIKNRTGFGGYYYSSMDWGISAYGANYEELINNIAEKFHKCIEDNVEELQDSEIGRYDITTARYMVFNGDVYVNEEFASESVIIEKTNEEIREDIMISQRCNNQGA